MIERPDSAGIWTREGKFYRVWTVDGRWFTQEITPSDGGLWPIYERNESSPFPPGNWHKLTAPATNAAARDKFRAWLATDKPLRGPIHKRVEEHVADKAAEIFAGVEREQIDWPRLREWAADQRKKPPQLAFTAGPEREIADLICMVVMSSELDQITTLKATVARLEGEVEKYKARLDPSICRLQFPDGSVPGDIQECAEGWKEAYDAKLASYRIAVKQIEDLETQVHQIAGLKGIIARQDEEITSLRLANIAEREQPPEPGVIDQLYRHAIDRVDRVFQECTENPKPILPDFLRLGEDKFDGVVKLAEAYREAQNQITTLKATVAKLEGEVATEHAKYINSERAATVALQAQAILKQADEIAELKQQPEVIEGNGQAVSEEQAGWYWAEGSKGTVAYMHIVAGSAFAQDCRYIKAVPPTFPPRKPAFVAPPKPEQFLYRWRRLNGTEEVFWTTKRSEGHYIGVLDGCMYTSGELIDEKTGEPIKEQA